MTSAEIVSVIESGIISNNWVHFKDPKHRDLRVATRCIAELEEKGIADPVAWAMNAIIPPKKFYRALKKDPVAVVNLSCDSVGVEWQLVRIKGLLYCFAERMFAV